MPQSRCSNKVDLFRYTNVHKFMVINMLINNLVWRLKRSYYIKSWTIMEIMILFLLHYPTSVLHINVDLIKFNGLYGFIIIHLLDWYEERNEFAP